MALVTYTDIGFYCERADLYIDPLRKVARAVVTHAHSDHARPGMGQYLCHTDGVGVLKLRLGRNIAVRGVGYGEVVVMNGVEVSLFPAGHVPGSAQVRLSYGGEVWVIAGDYKTEADGLSPAFEPVRCHHFVTESTFGLPIFQWRPQIEIFGDINTWWRGNAERGITSIMLGYSLGKAQRIMKYLDRGVGDVVCYSTISETNGVLAAAGFDFGTWVDGSRGLDSVVYRNGGLSEAMLVCPPAAIKSPWMRGLERFSVANCSGWMAVKKSRDWGGVDQGFVLSDHADWPQLLGAVLATGAENVYVTHGFSDAFSRHLRSGYGLNAGVAEVMMREGQGDE